MKKSILLSVIAIAGAVSTAVLASRAGRDAYLLKMNYQKQRDVDIPKKASEEKFPNEVVSQMLIVSRKIEKRKIRMVYAPVIISLGTTIACIIFHQRITSKQLSILAAGGAIQSRKLLEYRKKVKEKYGVDADKEIIAEIAKDDLKMYPALPDTDENERLFYDYWSKRFFKATPGRVREAIYHLNRNFSLGWTTCPNDLYKFIGIAEVPFGSNFRWYTDYMVYCGYEGPWIDVYTVEDKVDGKECLILYFQDDPITEEEYEAEM